MSVQDTASLGGMLAQSLAFLASCFHGAKGRRRLAVDGADGSADRAAHRRPGLVAQTLPRRMTTKR
ncbi:hypothetical protein Pla52o_43800 [Novipirellula galeiformis]|uniref:Uncharacterized protein n=1 Tax=Novipirellula galeiformis TaxID=2528004 RepID=A0A5C6C8L0_9BACT|nr:hypothetical protein Pla52o_43800 [Novipirellula galeiformis]